jgi:hypothetical protein
VRVNTLTVLIACVVTSFGTPIYAGKSVTPAVAKDLVVSIDNLALLKSALRLTQAQEQQWLALEAAIRDVAAQQASENGLVHRAGVRGATITLTDAALKQIAEAARPLMTSLNVAQKRTAMAVIRYVGAAPLF